MRRAHLMLAAVAIVAGALWMPAMAGKNEIIEKYLGKTFYLQSNLHIEGTSASWVNYIGSADFVPLGTKVKVTRVEEKYIMLQAEGRDKQIEFETKDATPGVEAALDRVLGEKPPSLDGLSESDRGGIKSGGIKKGMSRRAVFLAVGYPPYYYSPPFFLDKKSATNHDTDADTLTYMKSTWDFIAIEFKDGKVFSVED